jgi:DNA-binding response OmpR family regulator
MRRVLKGGDVEFLLSNSIAQAAKLLESSVVDMIILDRMLPDGDGVELLKKLRRTPALKKIPILILSGRAETLDQVTGLDLGADDYMTKPFSTLELKARVDALLRRSRKFAAPSVEE